MSENSIVYKIESKLDALKFIEDLKEYAYTGVYNYKLDTVSNDLQEVFIWNSLEPAAIPVIKKETRNISLVIAIEPIDEVIDHILCNKESYTALYQEVMLSRCTIQQAVKKLEVIKMKVKKEGHNFDNIIQKTIELLKKEIGKHNSVQVDNIIKEMDSFLVDRGFPTLGNGIVRYGCSEENYCHSDCYICPYLWLGERFNDYGIDVRKETREFIENDFLQNYDNYNESNCFSYNMEQIGGEYYCNLWIENGLVFRQILNQNDNKVLPIEQYQINNKVDIERLIEVLAKDIRRINHSKSFGFCTNVEIDVVTKKNNLDFCNPDNIYDENCIPF